MSKAIDIIDTELYSFLGVSKYATEKEIRKAYRKRALELHPDKNANDPKKAAERFQELSKVFEVLSDLTKKGEYDRKLKAKEEVERRNQQMGEEYRRQKRIFDEKEKEALLKKKEQEQKQREHEWLIQKLRAEGRKRQREEDERWAKEQEEKAKHHKEEEKSEGFNIRVSWKASKNDDKPAYSTDDIREMFSKYGEVLEVVKSQKKKGLYLVQLDSQDAAIVSLTETGDPSNPITVSLKFEVKNLSTENKNRGPKYDYKSCADPPSEEKIDFPIFTQPSDDLYEKYQSDDQPAKYVYPEGYDALFPCCRTIQLPPGVSVRDGEEIQHDGYIIKSRKAFDSSSKKKDYGGVTEHYMRQEKERERLIREMTENDE